MYEFNQIDLNDIDLREYMRFENKAIFTTPEWIRFVEEDSNAKPLVFRITKNGEYIGYFTSLVIVKFGIKIVASPFNGWSTCFMGLDVDPTADKTEVIQELSAHLFKKYRCAYIEIIDRDISIAQAKAAGFDHMPVETLELDVARSTDELFRSLKGDCRNFIRQFEKRGAVIEEAIPNEAFAEEYYEQLIDVFAKQGMVPTYSLNKVKCLMRRLGKTKMLLCLRVRDPEGKSIATSIFLGFNKKFFFWGGASFRAEQFYRPNESMIWYAIKYWRERGCETFDMVGVRDYKRKFGSVEKIYAGIMIPKYKILISLRNLAKKAYFFKLKAQGMIRRKK